MSVSPAISELLALLTPARREHSIEVGRKAERAAELVADHLREDFVIAAYLHDVGYGHPDGGFHPLDGARLLESQGYSSAVCHLVAHHTASLIEARRRGIDLSEFDQFAYDGPEMDNANRVLWWADMTTGPNGETVTVEERLAEILERYGADDVVAQSIQEASPLLIEVCHSVAGSMNGSV
ncbi:HD domain-containing protein [Aldersonia sp. NBC_00410]|uniref:HD domain-containing protein n=1 Tax=Aldersonia sp. NBC_00410 TaxID=2975954 RepID=UPI0022513A8E|nr:HD domain-containing protein [Aldersonia sp. NBC_00410]MCX5042519.1 HD domain-containing protein [Aldersonia sp. NBC_00410]